MLKKAINYKERLVGSLVALITPMHEDGSIDYPALQKLLKLHYQAGTSGIVLLGTTGEGSALELEERTLILECVGQVEKPKGVVLILGISGNVTAKVSRQIISLEKNHLDVLDAIMVVTPYYNKPTQEGLFQHYNALADLSPLPIILYNVPGRTAVDLSPEIVIRLAKHRNIIGIKDASGDINRVQLLIDNCKQDFSLLSGDDYTALDFIKAGGDGVISVVANAYPEELSKLYNAARSGELVRAKKINEIFAEIQKLLFIEANPIPINWLMAQKFALGNNLRLPLTRLSEVNQGVLHKAVLQVEERLTEICEV